jgi:mono/diheme cytochrome c family protein
MLATTAMAMLLVQNQSQAMGIAAVDGAAIYKAKCASCHGADGSANTAVGKSLKIRDLRSADVQKQSDAQLYNIVANGKARMPGYEKSLGADSCQALVACIRRLVQ